MTRLSPVRVNGDGYRCTRAGFAILGVFRPLSPPDNDGAHYYDTCGVMQQ